MTKRKSEKRKKSAWNKHLMKTFKTMRKKDKSTTLADAMLEAAKDYEKK